MSHVSFIREEKTMEKEVETANDMVNSEMSGGWHSFKEAVFEFFRKFLWLAFYSSSLCANSYSNHFGNNSLAYFESQKISHTI